MASSAKFNGLAKKFNVNRTPSRPKKRKTVTLVFDEAKRREFLGGFHKRKLERKQKAKDELEKQLKEERKRIKQDARENYKKLVVSHRAVPELEELLAKEEYEVDGHTVSVLELNAADLAEKSNWIGENRTAFDADDDEEEEAPVEVQSEDTSDKVVGMELEERKPSNVVHNKVSKEKDSTKLKSKKDVKREIRKKATKQVQKSKAFQTKQKMERQKNKKQSLQKQMLKNQVSKKGRERKSKSKTKTRR